MKRPQGFDQPAAPQPEPTGQAAARTRGPRRTTKPGTITPGRTTSGRSASARPAPGPGADAPAASDQNSTEPIVLPAPGARRIAPVRPLRRPAEAVESSGAPVPSRPDAQAAPGLTVGAPAELQLTPAGARRKFRAARRARKLYEREEVRRFTWRSRRRRTIWLVCLGVAAALAGFVLIGAYSPLMALKNIEVVGAGRVSSTEVQAALGEQLGTPLPLVDFAKVKKELSRFTLIRSYVTESRPPGTLVVRIVEREPIGAVVTPAGFDLVDAAGVVIQSGAERPAGYATIDARAGASSTGFQAAAAVIAALPDGIRGQLDTVTAATKDDVTLTLIGGARVVWGSAEKSQYKAVVLAALVVSHPVGSVGEYDVSSPDSAVLR
ncbi:FtsQ-type POTRA domain-containing protein [Cryobacterium algoritolerans]|uniref:FtsQ-type POTRA domain-containing protein n=1 Tax=Cryobacterium algoritolerans TaxID=1259184 RepID=A0A4R8WMM3_9MICO|nr:FtsQ-type POTRA domain-containing protein [Cryobacterium algoritolerans]TFC11043.1 FtsQ-type POTRA domain-containing protein [Cryobacterium algoritolerans]